MKNNAPGAERMTFRNRYLAVLTATLLLFSFCAQSQVTIGVRQKNLSKGIDFKEVGADSLLRPPLVRLPLLVKDSGAISLDLRGKKIWFFNQAGVWDTIAGGGGGGKIYKESFGIKITGPSIDSIKLDTSALPSLNVEGLGSIKKKNDSTIQVNYSKSIAELRARAAFGDTIVYESVINNIPSRWYYDAADITSPDDGFMILVSGGKRLKRYVEDRINVKWFGARGDNSNDDGPAIQAAIDWVIAHSNYTRTLYFPRGTYKIGQPLIIYKWNGSDYAAATIELLGEKIASFTEGTYNTIIRPTFNNTFCIGVQRGKSVKITGFYLQGVADGNSALTAGTYAAFVQKPFSTFMAGLCRDQRYSPYAGVVIDPFNIAVPPDGGYPGLSSYYRGALGGSSQMTVEDCRIYGYTVCVALGIAGSANNGESINLDRLTFGFTKVAVAVGHDQLKDNYVHNFIAWDWVHTMFDNQTYGSGYGNLPYVEGGNIAFAVNRLVNYYDSGRFPVYFRDIFAESLWQFGDLRGGIQSVVENCTFDFSTTPINSFVPSPDYYMSAANALFKGCMFRLYDAQPTRFAMSLANVHFTSCTFNELPLVRNPDQSGYQKVAYSNTLFVYPTVGTSIVGPTGPTVTQYGNGDITTTLGQSFQFTSSVSTGNGMLMSRVDDPLSEALLSLGTFAMTIDSATATGSVNIGASLAKLVQVGDYLFDLNSKLYIKVTAVNTSTGALTLGQAPFSLRTGSKILYLDYVRRLGASFVGTTTAGSPVITNVNTNAVPAGRIETNLFGIADLNSGVNLGAYIVSYDATAHTVTMNVNALASKTQVQFENASKISRTLLSQNEPTVANLYVDKGTEWIIKEDIGSNARDRKYIFTKGGYTVPSAGWQQQAEWYLYTPIRPKGSDSLESFDYTSNTWKTIKGGSGSGSANVKRVDFVAVDGAVIYQSDSLINKTLLEVSLEGVSVSFISRNSGPYITFNSTTGTVTLQNAVFADEEHVSILYKDGAQSITVFSPASVPNMYAWYDMTDASKVTVSSGQATVITDKSSNGRNMNSYGSSPPLYSSSGGANNKGYITIANNRELFTPLQSPTSSQPFTVYIVMKQTSFTDGKYIFNFNNGNTGQIQQYSQPAGPSTVMFAGNYFNRNTNAYKANTWEILSCVFNNVNSKLQVNNEPYKIGGYNPGQSGLSPINVLGFGPYYKSADAQIAEVLVFSGVPSDANDAAIRAYLTTKYNLPQSPFIAFFGDSITAGAAASNEDSSSFAALSAKEKSLDIINYGQPSSVAISRPGATGFSGGNLEDIYTKAFTGHLPSGYFVFAYGTNDIVPDATWKASYKAIIQEFITRGADPNKIIICTAPYRDDWATLWLATARTYCSQIATELGIKFYDAITYMGAHGGQSLMSGDGVHPSTAGHRVMADGLKLQIQ